MFCPVKIIRGIIGLSIVHKNADLRAEVNLRQRGYGQGFRANRMVEVTKLVYIVTASLSKEAMENQPVIPSQEVTALVTVS